MLPVRVKEHVLPKLPFGGLVKLKRLHAPIIITHRDQFRQIAKRFENVAISISAMTWSQQGKHSLSTLGIALPSYTLDSNMIICDPLSAGPELIKEDLKPLLESGGVKITHAAGYVSALLKSEYGVTLGPVFDMRRAFLTYYAKKYNFKHLTLRAMMRIGIGIDPTFAHYPQILQAEVLNNPLYVKERPLPIALKKVISAELAALQDLHHCFFYSTAAPDYQKFVSDCTATATEMADNAASFLQPPIDEYLHSHDMRKRQIKKIALSRRDAANDSQRNLISSQQQPLQTTPASSKSQIAQNRGE